MWRSTRGSQHFRDKHSENALRTKSAHPSLSVLQSVHHYMISTKSYRACIVYMFCSNFIANNLDAQHLFGRSLAFPCSVAHDALTAVMAETVGWGCPGDFVMLTHLLSLPAKGIAGYSLTTKSSHTVFIYNSFCRFWLGILRVPITINCYKDDPNTNIISQLAYLISKSR